MIVSGAMKTDDEPDDMFAGAPHGFGIFVDVDTGSTRKFPRVLSVSGPRLIQPSAQPRSGNGGGLPAVTLLNRADNLREYGMSGGW